MDDVQGKSTTSSSDCGNAATYPNIEPGVAPIKSEFLRCRPPPRTTTDSSAQATELQKDEPQQNNGSNRKRKRGQNKKRPLTTSIEKGKLLCPKLIADEVCEFGTSCRFLHDVDAFLQSKPPDLGDKCVIFDAYGKCPYGLACRYGSSHVNNKKNVIDEERLRASATKNCMSKEALSDLRKKKIQFPKADAYVKAISAMNDMKNDAAEGRSTIGTLTDEDLITIRPEEKKQINFSNKLFLAPLTTVGNLPFRRICKTFGADVTCSEMALCTNLLQGQQSEWALVKRHESEDLFGLQVCGAWPDTLARLSEYINDRVNVDFVDLNLGCPIDLVFHQGAGSALMGRANKLQQIVTGMSSILSVPLTVKLRTGILAKKSTAHKLIPQIREWGASLVTLHGRSREQRYTKLADWSYINECATAADPMPLIGNGDILSFEDYLEHMNNTNVAGVMIARGALIKPWLFTEIKERRHWDISANERFEFLRKYVNYGLEHWGSDSLGVEKTRRFLLEWLSFLHRYIPIGVLERVPQRINDRPPYYVGRNDLETMMSSTDCTDWVKLSEMLLGSVPTNFQFLPKHRANSYQ
ncbi:tRNA-dihydrouridine(47) synthase [NAD(P)(+)]-like [Trichoplax sp. H2]|nr:tRNA-dihydrouridine(47) synthase [NAD(P)(+)]-like [Trichoplax sp. H2]|eukprot:RDD37049.1 tRNA-dihydrouridine(47) synthase [NAD(P)(+)]-like [Trichoplax sp. H2]